VTLFDLSPKEFAALSALLGLSLLPSLTTTQQNSLGNFLMGIGQMLESAAAQQAVTASAQPNRIDELQHQIKCLEERLDALEKGLADS
jgi:hypothetical protein